MKRPEWQTGNTSDSDVKTKRPGLGYTGLSVTIRFLYIKLPPVAVSLLIGNGCTEVVLRGRQLYKEVDPAFVGRANRVIFEYKVHPFSFGVRPVTNGNDCL